MVVFSEYVFLTEFTNKLKVSVMLISNVKNSLSGLIEFED